MSEQVRGASLEELAALNEELGALARAGVPLEAGLAAVGRDVPGRLGAAMRRLAERLARGEALPDALAAERGALPAVYAAAVQAGLRAGRLPAVLECLAETAYHRAELRRTIGLSLLYPVIVLLVAWGLFVAFVVLLVPTWQQTLESLRLESPRIIAVLGELRGSARYWGWAMPIVVLLLGFGWGLARRATVVHPGWVSRLFGWIPTVRSMLADSSFASLAEVLSLLVEHEVPLPEALELAGAANGDAGLSGATVELAGRLRRGLSTDALGRSDGLPPFVAWSLANARRLPLALVLRDYADYYRRRALQQAAVLRAALPAVLLVLIGGSATFLYALALLVPLTQLWMELPNV